MLQVLSLNTPQKKEEFIEKVLKPLDESGVVTSQVVDAAKGFFPSVSVDDITRGLEKYLEVSEGRRNALKQAIREIDLSSDIVYMPGFESIAERINYNVTGDKNDNRGLILMVEVLKKIQEELPEDAEGVIVVDGEDARWKLKFKIPTALQATIRDHINSLLPYIETLYNKIIKYDGEDVFEKLLNYAETTVNSFGAEEVTAFKSFLYNNGGMYEPPLMFDIETKFTVDGKDATELISNGILNAEVTVKNNSAEDVDALLIIALYKIDGDSGIMECVSYNTKKVVAGAEEKLMGGFRLPSDATGYEARVFVWEGTDIINSTMVPLSEISKIPAAE